MKIAIGSDHAGYKLKKNLEAYLKQLRVFFKDFGTHSEESCDYPDFAFPVARAVASGKFTRGILICGSGVGVTIAANRIKGVRAVNAVNAYIAKQSREHGDSNVLCLAGRRQKIAEVRRIVDLWLKTKFSGDERHARRIEKLDG